MRVNADGIRLSASDLGNHLACRHLTSLDFRVTTGQRTAPKWQSPDLWVLQQRGFEHEKAYIEHLVSRGLAVTDLRDVSEEEAIREVVTSMQNGVDVIVQPPLGIGPWFGRADILARVERASKIGPSYEVYDCKLAFETKARTILQLSLYSECIAAIQGAWPEHMYVVPPNDGFTPEMYRVAEYSAYYRYVKGRLETAVDDEVNDLPTYPEPTPHCPICRWWEECDALRRKDDHLSLVAGINKLQQKQLQSWDVKQVAKLAILPVPLEKRPEHGSSSGYVRIREQARIQVAGRSLKAPVHEILELSEEHGFCLLPEPSPGDVFFDLEGDPFIGRGGREFLFGCKANDGDGKSAYDSRWAMNAEQERLAFEWFVDLVISRWAQFPAMHVYHFTGYESGALKRLMGRYATREDEIDRMLRAGLLIDLHKVVKRSIRASVEQYSLKALEAFYEFQRKVPLEDARVALRQVQHSLELGLTAELDESARKTIAGYNADDCESTRVLRDWLESERGRVEQGGRPISRPLQADGTPPETLDERQQRSAVLGATLRAGLPDEPTERTEEQAACWLLSHLLDWHRRELKSEWWEFYRFGELSDEELLDERSALSGLKFIERLGVVRNIPTDRYAFEKQETDIRIGDELCAKKEKIGEVVAIDLTTRLVDIKKTKKTAEIDPVAVYAKDIGPGTDFLADALYRIGKSVTDNGVDSPGSYRAARDLLLRRAPRLSNGTTTLVLPGETTLDAAKRVGGALDHSLLAIQGPPGAGKTFTGARMICELVRRGKRVGITATSHKVIGNLVSEVLKAASEEGLGDLRCVQKVNKKDKHEQNVPQLRTTTENKDMLIAFEQGANVLAGTQWLWAREEYSEAVDVLFVDEAGQMSLANVLVVAQAAKSLVLLGDPQQLEQPLRGSHPEGADSSALEHVLGEAKTIPPDKGLFLEKTWRLHPELAKFTSEVFYEGRLKSREGLENQRIEGHPALGDSGLRYLPVRHQGNRNASPEEVEAVYRLVATLVQPGMTWVNDKGHCRPLTLKDILIVAPYNTQVSDLSLCMPDARIGTVDKFQGQQAPIVIYSMTTSSPEDAPRGMEFLYSLNRLNVATSRAQAMVIVVASPRLLEPECNTPRQMQLANALCRYAELARAIPNTTPTETL